MNYLYSHFFQRAVAGGKGKAKLRKPQPLSKRRRAQISLEQLEDRLVLSTMGGLDNQACMLPTAVQGASGPNTALQEISNVYQELYNVQQIIQNAEYQFFNLESQQGSGASGSAPISGSGSVSGSSSMSGSGSMSCSMSGSGSNSSSMSGSSSGSGSTSNATSGSASASSGSLTLSQNGIAEHPQRIEHFADRFAKNREPVVFFAASKRVGLRFGRHVEQRHRQRFEQLVGQPKRQRFQFGEQLG